jgi:hypothetical protein
MVKDLKEHGCRRAQREACEPSETADDQAVLCCYPSIRACDSVMRYSTYIVVASVMEGPGITLDQAPVIFQLIDDHLQTIFSQTERQEDGKLTLADGSALSTVVNAHVQTLMYWPPR